jgi:hypothetical protein
MHKGHRQQLHAGSRVADSHFSYPKINKEIQNKVLQCSKRIWHCPFSIEASRQQLARTKPEIKHVFISTKSLLMNGICSSKDDNIDDSKDDLLVARYPASWKCNIFYVILIILFLKNKKSN